MYQGPGGMVNRDEYLLGRPIDKYVFEKMEEKETGCSSETGLLPGSIFAPSGANSLLDMASKIREDPLFIIRYWWRAGKGVLLQRYLVEMLDSLSLHSWFPLILSAFICHVKHLSPFGLRSVGKEAPLRVPDLGRRERDWQMDQTRFIHLLLSLKQK